MPRAHLTDIAVKSFKAPAVGQVTYTDDALPGFGVRVSKGGTRTFVVVCGDRRERVTIGRYPIVSLSQARSKAKAILAERTLNPNAGPTIAFDEALIAFFETHCKVRNKPSTVAETKRILNRHFLPALGGRNVADISTHQITRILDNLLETPGECNHAFTAVRTFFHWARDRRYIAHSPLDGLRLPTKPVSRDRVLSDAELRQVLARARAFNSYGMLVQFILLTGQRPGQIATLHSDHINREKHEITWPAALMKGNREHTIPYGDMVAQIVARLPQEGLLFPTERGVPFNNWSTTKAKFDAECPVAHWTLHDLRRTFATNLAALAVPPHVTERILAHATGTLSPVAKIYNRYSYMDEMRAAIGLWENKLRQLHLSVVAA